MLDLDFIPGNETPSGFVLGTLPETGETVTVAKDCQFNRNFFVCGRNSNEYIKFLISQYAKNGSSMFVVDSTGGLYKDMMEELKGHGYEVFLWNPLKEGSCSWNPLLEIFEKSGSENLEIVVLTSCPDRKTAKTFRDIANAPTYEKKIGSCKAYKSADMMRIRDGEALLFTEEFYPLRLLYGVTGDI